MKAAQAEAARPLTSLPVLSGLFVALYAALAAIYWPALRGSLLWNDPDYVTKPALQGMSGLVRIWTEPGATEQYYPLLHTAFWIEHRLWGDAPLGYHLANLAFHALSCVLLFGILERLSVGSQPGEVVYPRGAAWLAVMLFAFHPVCVESVGWISEQKNTLSLVFCLASFMAYLRYERIRTRGAYAVALGLFLCAILSKSLTATLPAVLWVVSWWRRGRLEWRRDILPLLPWCLCGAAIGLLTAWDERHFGGAEGIHFEIAPAARFAIAGRVVWFYLGKIVWPHPLMFFYERWHIDASAWNAYVGLAAVIVATLALVAWARRERGPLCCWLLFIGTLFPVIGFLNVYAFVFSFVADHWQYLPMVAVLVGLAAVWDRVFGAAGLRSVGNGCAVFLLVGLAGLSFKQSGLYASVDTLYRGTLAANPDAWLPHANLGTLMMDQAQPEKAAVEFRKAIALVPNYPELHANLANAYALMNQLPEAVGEYRAALELRPDYANAHGALGRVLIQMGKASEAVPQFADALRYQPGRAEWEMGLGLALAEAGNPREAVEHDESAVRIDPGFAEAYNNEGNALAQLGRIDPAIDALRTAVRLKPDYLEARKNLATLLERSASVLANRGELERATGLYREAVDMAPEFAAARSDLGLALTLSGHLGEAIGQLSEAVRLAPRSAQAHAYLGLALSRSGRLSEAIAEFDTSLAIAPGDPDVVYQRDEARRRLGVRP